MRETSVFLGVVQFMMTAFLLALLIWFAAVVAAVGLVVWAVIHLVTAGQRPVVAGAPAPPVPAEPRNPVAVAAALVTATATVPFLLGHAAWPTVLLSVAGLVLALSAFKPYSSPLTRTAMKVAAVSGAALAVFALFGTWLDRPITLYGENSGDRQGEMTSVAQMLMVLPCIDESDAPAEVPDLYTLDLDKFPVSLSCTITAAEDAQPTVFVQAESAAQLEALFASGVITSTSSDDNELWVQRDGAVAVITADEASEELAQDVGATWISLSDDRR